MREREYRLARRAVLGGMLGLGLQATLANNEAMAAERPEGPLLLPRVHTRREWGARPARRRAEVLDRAPDHIVVHHTSTPNVTDYSVDAAYDLSRAIQRFHMRTRGWNDAGQQLTISRGGHIMEGRNRSLTAILSGRHCVGAQALHHNDHTIGIENEGTYMTADVPGRLWESLVHTCAWLCDRYDLNPYQALVGHRDYGRTDCPGDVLYSRLPALREEVAGLLRFPSRKSAPRIDTDDLPADPGEAMPSGTAHPERHDR
ncbi:hypothetical protein GCM10009678_70680 [Actinomadura kijaniata]